MNFSMDRYYIVTLDTSDPSPIFGRIDDEDTDKDIFLVAVFNLPRDYQHHRLFTADDLKGFAIFKGREEAIEWVRENYP